MVSSSSHPMLRFNTPIEDYTHEFGLYVKREDLACPPPGPPFSKTRGVYARVQSRPEHIIGVLDTYHSQAGHAVARACQVLGKHCINYYPLYKNEDNKREPQGRALMLGAELVGLPAGRSCILYHQARKHCEGLGGYMMPNALKLEESVIETAKEVPANFSGFDTIIIPASSGTIAAGVIRGVTTRGAKRWPEFIVHLGYSRSHEEVLKYLLRYNSSDPSPSIVIIDEGYAYKDVAREGPTPPWPCSRWYDLKAFRWYMRNRRRIDGKVLLWNVG